MDANTANWVRLCIFDRLSRQPVFEPVSVTRMAAYVKGALGRPIRADAIRAELERWDVIERVGDGYRLKQGLLSDHPPLPSSAPAGSPPAP